MKSGLVVMDKPGGMTSHEIVTRVRRIMGSRKVGHAGTIATIRLGSSTTTDDADGAIGSLFHWIPALAVDLDDVAFKHDNVVYGVRELPVTW